MAVEQASFGFMVPPPRELIVPGALLLRGFALPRAQALHAAVSAIADAAPFRHLETPGGKRMSAAMTNCGALGWVSDQRGYRYAAIDPVSGRPWPAMPEVMRALAHDAAAAAGFEPFVPDACLVNRYEPGAQMTLHQDKNERDFTQPIVSVSLGLPIGFLFGGMARGDRALRVPLEHGDVVVWGGEARLRFHGVARLRDGQHAEWGRCRVNLTLRRAG